jgi:hypothetical protein
MIRVPVPTGISGPIAIGAGALVALALVLVMTATGRAPGSPVVRWGARLFGGVASAWGFLIAVEWFKPHFSSVQGSHGLAALLFAAGALGLTMGERPIEAAAVATLGAFAILALVYPWMFGHLDGPLILPTVCLLALAVVIVVRRRR